MQVSLGDVMWLGKNTRRLMKPMECGAYSMARMRSVAETVGSEAASRRAAVGSTARCRNTGALLGGLALAGAVAGTVADAGTVGMPGCGWRGTAGTVV
jgi:hypothetical protein